MIFALAVALATIRPDTTATDHLTLGAFGTVTVYRPTGAPTRVALFYSGDGGWNEGVITMARAATEAGILVLGIDTPRYLRAIDAEGRGCGYYAGDGEQLSQYAQRALGLPRYLPPLLLGYSSGGGVAYAALAQAPDNTFEGAVTLGFDPHLPARTPPCPRNGLTSRGVAGGHQLVAPVSRLPGRWVLLQGQLDEVSPSASARAFASQVSDAEFRELAGVGHGFGVADAWQPSFTAALEQTAAPGPAPSTGSLADLPLVALPAPATPSGEAFAVVLSGDGGWASLDKQVAGELVSAGIPTVGFNSLQYFWQKRTPDRIAADLGRIIRAYGEKFHRTRVALVGYSRGADVLPLMVSRLPADLLARVELVALFGLEHQTNLEFRLGDWLGAQHDAAYPLLPELEKIRGTPLLCVYGEKEGDTLCPDLPPGLGEVIRLTGGHHFDGDYRGLARLILDRLSRPTGSG